MPKPKPTQAWLMPVLAVFSLVFLTLAIVFKFDVLSTLAKLPPQVSEHVRVENMIRELNVRVLVMQTSRRAFLSTGRDEHLATFDQAAAEARSWLEQLRVAMDAVGDPYAEPVRQHARKLEQLMPAYETELRRSIRLHIEAPNNATEQSRLTVSVLAMTRALIDELGGTGSGLNQQIKHHVDDIEAVAAQAETAEAVLGGITLATVTLGFGVAAVQMRRRATLQQALAAANQNLEAHVEARTAALTESELRYRTLVELAVDAVLLVQRDLTVAYANAAAHALMQRLGRKAVEGQPIDVLLLRFP